MRLVKGGWSTRVERLAARFVWQDPRVVTDSSAAPADFRAAMSAFYLGGTFKITGEGRHPLGDELLLRNVSLEGASIVDIGASDGSTSVDLIDNLASFTSFTIADRFISVNAASALGRTFF